MSNKVIDSESVQMIVQLRKYVISEHKKLINEAAATMTHREVADILSTVIHSIDDIVREFVTFK